MTLSQAVAFVLFATAAAVTPGPSMIMLAAIGALVGFGRGIPALLGVASGMALMMFCVSFGLGSIVLGHPSLIASVKWVGAAFLLWLSWKIATAPAGMAETEGRPVGFLGAAALQALNPKSWLVSTSAAGTFLSSDGSVLIQALWIGGLFFCVAMFAGVIWLGFGVAVRRILSSPRRHRIFNGTMGALLAISVVMLF